MCKVTFSTILLFRWLHRWATFIPYSLTWWKASSSGSDCRIFTKFGSLACFSRMMTTGVFPVNNFIFSLIGFEELIYRLVSVGSSSFAEIFFSRAQSLNVVLLQSRMIPFGGVQFSASTAELVFRHRHTDVIVAFLAPTWSPVESIRVVLLISWSMFDFHFIFC